MKALIAAGLLLAPVLGQAAEPAESPTALTQPSQSVPSALEFIRAAAMNDRYGLQADQLAAQRGSPRLRDFAQKLTADQAKSFDALKRIAVTRGAVGRIPDELDREHRQRMDRLQAADAGSFDRAYLAGQIQADDEAIALFQRYAKDGGDKQLKDWAVETLPALQQRRTQAEALAR